MANKKRKKKKKRKEKKRIKKREKKKAVRKKIKEKGEKIVKRRKGKEEKRKGRKKERKEKKIFIWFKKKRKKGKKEKKRKGKKRKRIIKEREKKKIIEKGKKEKKKTQGFFNVLNNKFTNFIKNIRVSQNLKSQKEKREKIKELKEKKKKEDYIEIFDLLNKKIDLKKEKKIITSDVHPAIREILNEKIQKYPQLNENARLEITKAIAEIQNFNIQKFKKEEILNQSPEEGIRSFMNELPTITELTEKKIEQKEKEDIDDNRQEFRTRLMGEVNRIKEKH